MNSGIGDSMPYTEYRRLDTPAPRFKKIRDN
jgi:hypothetical protein